MEEFDPFADFTTPSQQTSTQQPTQAQPEPPVIE